MVEADGCRIRCKQQLWGWEWVGWNTDGDDLGGSEIEGVGSRLYDVSAYP